MVNRKTPEFALIDRYFKRLTRHTLLAGGDDAALVHPSPGNELVISSDMLVAGTHFYADTDAENLGWKTLAVNVSDMAAMGAAPRWALLALALPQVEEDWIAAFARGFYACADAFGVDLIGGDTTRGPLNLCVTIFGEIPLGQAIRRSGAQPGDDIWISGTPGRAGLGLAHLQGRVRLSEPQSGRCLAALTRPQPRVALGLALRGLASAALDVSDGLIADLGHILEESAVAADLRFEQLPAAGIERDCYLGGGDDYELLFTAAPDKRDAIRGLGERLQLPLTRIGQIVAGDSAVCEARDADGGLLQIDRRGFDHFGA